MKSIFAARERYWRGLMSKDEFNRLVAREIVAKWTDLVKKTPREWQWLCELSAYLELKHLGYE